jgi:hypothetical protein
MRGQCRISPGVGLQAEQALENLNGTKLETADTAKEISTDVMVLAY